MYLNVLTVLKLIATPVMNVLCQEIITSHASQHHKAELKPRVQELLVRQKRREGLG
jgi:hypothetical protein